MIKLLIDTHIGTNVDEARAQASLLAQPECDLLGIKTVTGKRAEQHQDASQPQR